jgi:aminopeptidase-like protein
MRALNAELFPICRSIDWTISRKWNISDAYIKNGAGDKVVDFSQSSLHVMSYSVPAHTRISLDELKKHVHTLHPIASSSKR